MDKLIRCRVDNCWYSSIERASLTFHSPTGGWVRIDKRYLNRLSDYQIKLIWDLHERTGTGDHIDLTLGEMKTLVVMGWAAGDTYQKNQNC